MWTYDPTDLNTTNEAGRINVVRFLIGDTDTSDQQVQNEEIIFSLLESTNNVYTAAAYCASSLAAKYSRFVNTDLDGALAEDYSDLSKNYKALAAQLKQDGIKFTIGSLGVFMGGVSYTEENTVRANPDRPSSAFERDQFKIEPYTPYEY